MKTTLDGFGDQLVEEVISNRIRVLLCDIDGTLMRGNFVAGLLETVLSELGLPGHDVEPILGTENLFQPGAISRRFSVDSETERRIADRYNELFCSTPTSTFRRAVYPHVRDSLDHLWRWGVAIGVFSLRHYKLAIHQIQKAGLAQYVYSESHIPNGTNLKITGSGLAPSNQLDGYEEKLYQLRLHLDNGPAASAREILVAGDSPDTDIKAAMTLKLRRMLIVRR
jgi:phosphoglycolate phosphatase-like HAD superfamily hydrolase